MSQKLSAVAVPENLQRMINIYYFRDRLDVSHHRGIFETSNQGLREGPILNLSASKLTQTTWFFCRAIRLFPPYLQNPPCLVSVFAVSLGQQVLCGEDRLPTLFSQPDFPSRPIFHSAGSPIGREDNVKILGVLIDYWKCLLSYACSVTSCLARTAIAAAIGFGRIVTSDGPTTCNFTSRRMLRWRVRDHWIRFSAPHFLRVLPHWGALWRWESLRVFASPQWV